MITYKSFVHSINSENVLEPNSYPIPKIQRTFENDSSHNTTKGEGCWEVG